MSAAQGGAAEVRELHTGDTHLAHDAMRVLRPAFDSEERFVSYVDQVLRPSGYRLAGTFLGDRASALGIAGFRIGDSLAWGHYLYVDDLCTAPGARGRGHASMLLEWLAAEGRRLGCRQLHLDSGTGPARFAAHRLYHKQGFSISSHHFARML